MCVDEMKTIGAAETTLGFLDLSLALILHQVPTPFRKVLPVVYCTAVMTTCVGLFLICGGRNPGYSCVRLNTVLHLPVVLLNLATFGFLVQFVPFRLTMFQIQGGSTVLIERYTTRLIGGVLNVLIVSLLLEAVLSLYLALIGWSVMIDLAPQTQVPECSATTEPLCVEMSQDSAPDQTILGLNHDSAPDQTILGLNQDSTPDQTKPGLNQDPAPDQTIPGLNQDSTLDIQSSETYVQINHD